MAFSVKRGLSALFKPISDIPRWLDSERIVEAGSFIKSLTNRILVVNPSENKESFEEALRRLNVTEEALKARARQFLLYMVLFLVVAALIFSYAYLLWQDKFYRATGIAIVVGCIPLSQVFRYHFWRFQIKKRKLGCSLKEWIYQGILRLKL